MYPYSLSIRQNTENLIQELYPKIQFKLVLLSSEIDVIHSPINPFSEHLIDVYTDLKNEFQSLVNYETKLVFPKVLHTFNGITKIIDEQYINILELQLLVQNKELKVLDLAATLRHELSGSSDYPLVKIFKDLISIVQNDFVKQKKSWHLAIKDGMRSGRNAEQNPIVN